jgi:formylglycine-generating enzyme required for sulfatase activity
MERALWNLRGSELASTRLVMRWPAEPAVQRLGRLIIAALACWGCSRGESASGGLRDAATEQTVRSVETVNEPIATPAMPSPLEVDASVTSAPPPGACPGDMVYVPGGTFTMGDDENVRQARHEVTLSAYCIDRTEVTQGEYKRCLAAKACTPPKLGAPDCNYTEPDRDAHPINCVNWVQASAYCRWARKRLPTEAEWEFAARGTDGRRYAWGNDPDVPPYADGVKVHWAGGTVPVGSRPGDVSPFGVLDMGESVTEWVGDWSAPYGASAQTNPRGPKTGHLRIWRGDNYSGSVGIATERGAGHPLESAMGEIGLRCARSVNATRTPR